MESINFYYDAPTIVPTRWHVVVGSGSRSKMQTFEKREVDILVAEEVCGGFKGAQQLLSVKTHTRCQMYNAPFHMH